jgi:hypothetical protein
MARAIIQGFAEQGGYTVTTDGRVSTTKVQRSFPGCTVNVYLAGTLTPASIFSDVGGTPKANPFIASTDGYWFFWADDGQYDVKFSGGGITTPFSLFNFTVGQSGALNDPGSNGILARTAANTVTPRTITGVTNETAVTDGNGVLGNPTIGLAMFLEFTGKTLNGGTYLSPGITSFASALHNHSDATGGGQMSASNVFSTGTVPVARLPVMVGASGIANGTAGLVPQPLIADAANFLRGDGIWATAGGGGGSPGGAANTIQYNNGGAFGGVSGATGDGTNITFGSTNLRATSPRITTDIRDSNGNAIITLSAVGTAVNNLQIANAAAAGTPTISAIGSDSNININITPKGTGVIFSSGNATISNVAPQLTLIDTNDSKQARLLLSGSNLSLINDTLGSTPLNIDTTSNLVTLAGDLVISNADPKITWEDTTGGDDDYEMSANGDNFNFKITGGSDVFNVAGATQVLTFAQIPVGPAANPTTANQLVRKQALDDATLPFTYNWFEYDPSASTSGTEDRPAVHIGPLASGLQTVTKIKVYYNQGSHTSGGDLRFTVRRRGPSGFTDFGPITLDNTNNTINTVYSTNATIGLQEGDTLTYYISTRSGTISERAVTIAVIGTMKRTNP